MDPTFELPFFAPQHRLPAPLPSQADIESSKVLKENEYRRVVLYDNCYVIKYGKSVSLLEGENMLFVKEKQAAPVPEVFALYSKKMWGKSINYIVMEYIPGQGLDAIWDGLDSSQKAKISSRLRLHFDALRSLPTPGYFGSIGKRPLADDMFRCPRVIGATYDSALELEKALFEHRGPFDSELELNNALVDKYRYSTGLHLRPKLGYYRRVLPLVLQNHNSVFTHCDLQRKNIIVRDDGEMVLIGWETAGWYPEYWEYISAMIACGAWEYDWRESEPPILAGYWHESVPHILAEYANEYAWFDMMFREMYEGYGL